MIEIHNNATPFDGSVFVASCDKGMPAHLMGAGEKYESLYLCNWRCNGSWSRYANLRTNRKI
ncbi:MAG: dihydroxy-acid dehydratase [Thomasclavelia ramosa]